MIIGSCVEILNKLWHETMTECNLICVMISTDNQQLFKCDIIKKFSEFYRKIKYVCRWSER